MNGCSNPTQVETAELYRYLFGISQQVTAPILDQGSVHLVYDIGAQGMLSPDLQAYSTGVVTINAVNVNVSVTADRNTIYRPYAISFLTTSAALPAMQINLSAPGAALGITQWDYTPTVSPSTVMVFRDRHWERNAAGAVVASAAFGFGDLRVEPGYTFTITQYAGGAGDTTRIIHYRYEGPYGANLP